MAEQKRRSLRARITLAATATATATALVLGAVAFAAVLKGELVSQITAAVETGAEQYAGQVEAS